MRPVPEIARVRHNDVLDPRPWQRCLAEASPPRASICACCAIVPDLLREAEDYSVDGRATRMLPTRARSRRPWLSVPFNGAG